MWFCHQILKTLVFAVMIGGALPALADNKPAERPDHWVAAMYFHRTQRCPTCKTISAYIEEATKSGFARDMQRGAVGFYLIDFQDAKNKEYTQSYKVTGPTLVIADIRGGKVAQWKPMPKVWSLVFKKEDFFKYVQDGIAGYLEEK